MVSRVAIAWAVLQFLILLSLLESILTFIFSLLLGKTVKFPLIVWLELILSGAGNWLLGAIHLFGVAIGTMFLFFTPETFVNTLFDQIFASFGLIIVFVYPLAAVADTFFLSLFDYPLFMLFIVDSLLIGGSPVLLDPSAPNIVYFIYNIGDIPSIIVYFLSALLALGYRGGNVIEAWISYTSMNRTERRGLWAAYNYYRYGDTGGFVEGGTGARGSSLPEEPDPEAGGSIPDPTK